MKAGSAKRVATAPYTTAPGNGAEAVKAPHRAPSRLQPYTSAYFSLCARPSDRTRAMATVTDNDAGEDDSVAAPVDPTPPTPPAPAGPQLKPKMLIAPLLMMGGKKLGIDYALPEILFRVRFAFVLTMTLCLAVCALMYAIVHRRDRPHTLFPSKLFRCPLPHTLWTLVC